MLAPSDFHRRLPGYAPTGLVDAPSLAARLDVARVWVKDESSRLGLPAFKILGASWATYRVLDERFGLAEWATLDDLRALLEPHRPLALATATDGNHGRAVARMARLLGLGARIFVPRGTAAARIEAIESEGATVTVVAGTYDDAVVVAADQAGERCFVVSDHSWPGYEEVPRRVIEGYSTIFNEIEAVAPDLVAVQVGVGALAAAVVRHYRGRARVIGVEPARSASLTASLEAGRIATIPGPHDSIMAGLNCGTPSLVAWPDLVDGLDRVVAIEDERAREAMRLLAGAGIVAGETGAAGLGGLLDLAAAGELEPDARVLCFCTEGATDPAAYERIVGRPARRPVRATPSR